MRHLTNRSSIAFKLPNVTPLKRCPRNGQEKTGDIQRPRTRPSVGVHRRNEAFLFDGIRYTSEGVPLVTRGWRLPMNRRTVTEAVERA